MECNLNQLLLGLLGTQELVETWWATPNKAFDGEIPDDIFHSDRKAEVVAYIMRHSGFWI